MAVKFFGMIKELKNISVYLSNGGKKQSRNALDERTEIIPPASVLYNADSEFPLKPGKPQIRIPTCSTSSSIDSANSTSSSDSNDASALDSGKQHSTLTIGDSAFHKVTSASTSSQQSSGYSTIKSKTDLDQLTDPFDQEIDLGITENPHVKPDDFEFLKVIGQGSYGKVLLARDRKELRVYAVKVLQKKMIIKRNEENHIMCERNVLLKSLNHPFLVNLHYSFQTREKLYFILEYVNGGELYFHLQKESHFSEPRARFYAAEITSALGYLHANCIVYRDLKPENILLDSEGHIILTDFGLCKDGLKQNDTTNTFCGSIDYLSPEILRKEAYGWSVDWWCLGSVIYEMLYGLPPFYCKDQYKMFNNVLHKPVKLHPNTSAPAKDLIMGLLQKNKEDRLGSTNDAEEIKSHEFFRSINWVDLENKRIKPPFNPNVKHAMDIRNISPEFTNETIPASLCRSTSVGPSSIPEHAQHAFQGFSYAANMYNS